MGHLDEWQILSLRYGTHDPLDTARLDAYPWGMRHHPHTGFDLDRASGRVMAARLGMTGGCICPGSTVTTSSKWVLCKLAPTQEDLLCNECRLWCVAVDEHGDYHQLASLPVRTVRTVRTPTAPGGK